MKRFFIGLTAVAVALAPTSALAKSELEGRWKHGEMEIIIAPCGGTLCGRVVKASEAQQARSMNGSGTKLLGARVIDNIEPAGPRTWRADMFVPSQNMNAHGTIEQTASDKMTVHGCVLAFLCKTQHWQRIG